jgi:tRNA(Ile)-lysidine synthase
LDLLIALRQDLATEQLTGRFERLLVGFSAGTDSTALLGGLAALSDELKLEVHAAHLDHALDPDSSRRARAAQALSRDLSIPFHADRRPVHELRKSGESYEAAARRIRYQFLEETRNSIGATRTLTAHHRRDQMETVLLRLLHGSGPTGLAGIRRHLGPVSRPLLDVPPEELARFVHDAGLDPVQDPTNYDLTSPRGRVRHLLLPHLLEQDSTTGDRLIGLSKAAAGFRSAIEARISSLLEPKSDGRAVLVERQRLIELPEALALPALAMLHHEAGWIYPPPRAAVKDLFRQLRRVGRVGCDIGSGWRWESEGPLLRLGPVNAPTPAFAYTLQIPGEVDIPEVSTRFRLQ